nr:SMI1/KNR4 family protein [Deinococcus betulae]
MDYQQKNYISPPFTPDLLASIEAELGHRLPASFVTLMRSQNGGIPERTAFPTGQATSRAEDHIAISGLFGIGRDKPYSLCGPLGSLFMMEEWDYPAIGVYIADCPSAGHDMVALDYRACGPQGEPAVVHVDQEAAYHITPLAPDFATFIAGLQDEARFEDDPEDSEAEDLTRVRTGAFSPELQALLAAFPDPALPERLRALAAVIVQDKGFFALHADPHSQLMYDLLFLLYSHSHVVRDEQRYLEEAYPPLIALADSRGVATGGYAPGFLEDWLREAKAQGRVVTTAQGLQFTPEATQAVLTALAAVPTTP